VLVGKVHSLHELEEKQLVAAAGGGMKAKTTAVDWTACCTYQVQVQERSGCGRSLTSLNPAIFTQRRRATIHDHDADPPSRDAVCGLRPEPA
jgi:hypothetical protein